MKILVSFKSVPDPNDVAVAGGAVSTPKSVINSFDEIAIEEALRIRERGEATEIVGATIGAPAVDEQIRTALAMGVDRVVRIDDSRALDPYAVSRILGAMVKKEAPHVVIMGKQAVDDDSNQVGQMLAALVGWPQAKGPAYGRAPHTTPPRSRTCAAPRGARPLVRPRTPWRVRAPRPRPGHGRDRRTSWCIRRVSCTCRARRATG